MIQRKKLTCFLFASLFFYFYIRPLAPSSCHRDAVTFPQKVPSAAPTNFIIPDFGPDGLSDLTEEQKRKVFSGEVILTSSSAVTQDGRTVISAGLLFSKPLEKVWSILSATERQIEYLEDINELKILEEAANHNRMEFLVRIMGQEVRYTVVHHFVPEKYYFWWELDSSVRNDLKELFGFWRLYPAGDKTVARYGSYVRPAFPVPGFIRNWLFKRSVHTSLKKVKKFVEEEVSSKCIPYGRKNWDPLPAG